MRALAALLFALPGFAQLELFTKAGQPVTSPYEIGSAGTGSSVQEVFRILNKGEATVQITRLRVSGSGFRMSGAPSLPHFVVPGSNLDFTIVFTPPDYGWYSANIEINNSTYMLRGNGYASVSLYQDGKLVQPGATIDFGRVERGASTTLILELRNSSSAIVTTRTVYTGGGAFTIPAGNQAVILEPGQSQQFRVQFAPKASGVFRDELQIDRTNTWILTGAATEPPLPRPTLVLETPVLRSGEQGRVSVALQHPSKGKGRGRLTVQLRSATKDASVQFMNGQQTVEFAVDEGTSAVSSRDMIFQAGTTAGTLVITAEVGGYRDEVTVPVLPEAVQIDKAAARRAGQMLEVQVSGFDNTRTISEIAFTFFDRSGQQLPNGVIAVPATAEFTRWWETSELGGAFSSKAVFPVAGDTTLIGAVTVEIVNQMGKTKTDRLLF